MTEKRITVRLSNEELKIIDALTEQGKYNASDVIRMVLKTYPSVWDK
ncbi:MAG: ribbon-helix-helix domain-containing protein, partial [Candidatus Acidifodinimicrobium sp.]